MKKSPIYTRSGDEGETSLFGGTRVRKSDVRLHAYGSVDELNAVLGTVRADTIVQEPVREHLERIQSLLFVVGADLATPNDATSSVPRIEESHTGEIEGWIDMLDATLPPLKNFILPSGSHPGAVLHHARTIARRAERWMTDLSQRENVNHELLRFINRLSDYLFVAARCVNKEHGERESTVILKTAHPRK